jgi:26S proteasome regulatory subunit N10
LKHRQNKHQKQRVIAFIGSPLDCSVSDLVAMGKKLKKMNVAVDVVSFGEEGENQDKLEQFVAAVNAQDNR